MGAQADSDGKNGKQSFHGLDYHGADEKVSIEDFHITTFDTCHTQLHAARKPETIVNDLCKISHSIRMKDENISVKMRAESYLLKRASIQYSEQFNICNQRLV